MLSMNNHFNLYSSKRGPRPPGGGKWSVDLDVTSQLYIYIYIYILVSEHAMYPCGHIVLPVM